MHESIWHNFVSGGKMTVRIAYIKLHYVIKFSCYKGIIGEYSLDELFSKNEGKIRDKRIVRNLKNAKYKFMHEIDDDVNEMVAIRTKLAFQINI